MKMYAGDNDSQALQPRIYLPMYPRHRPLQCSEGFLGPTKDSSIGFLHLDLTNSFATHIAGFEKDTDLFA